METDKLYRVTLRGMTYNSTGVIHGVSYVIAKDSDTAYKKLREHLDKKNIGLSKDRALDKIELVAEAYEYTETKTVLFL